MNTSMVIGMTVDAETVRRAGDAAKRLGMSMVVGIALEVLAGREG